MDRNAWGTPPHIIELARDLMGSIGLDPASNAKAQDTVVKAAFWCGLDHPASNMRDGLAVEWGGLNVWLNPPYGRGLVLPFVRKLLASRVREACVLVNATVETEAGQLLLDKCNAVWFPDHRLKFAHPETGALTAGGKHPQMLCYFDSGHAVATQEHFNLNDNARRKLLRALDKHNLKGVVR